MAQFFDLSISKSDKNVIKNNLKKVADTLKLSLLDGRCAGPRNWPDHSNFLSNQYSAAICSLYNESTDTSTWVKVNPQRIPKHTQNFYKKLPHSFLQVIFIKLLCEFYKQFFSKFCISKELRQRHHARLCQTARL